MLHGANEFFERDTCAVKTLAIFRLNLSRSVSLACCACLEKNKRSTMLDIIRSRTSIFCMSEGVRLGRECWCWSTCTWKCPALYSAIEASGSKNDVLLTTIPVYVHTQLESSCCSIAQGTMFVDELHTCTTPHAVQPTHSLVMVLHTCV